MLLEQQDTDRLFLNNIAKCWFLPLALLCNAGGELGCKETLCDHLTWEPLLEPFSTPSPHLDDADVASKHLDECVCLPQSLGETSFWRSPKQLQVS